MSEPPFNAPSSIQSRHHLQEVIAHALNQVAALGIGANLEGPSTAIANAIDQHMRQLIDDYHRNNSVLTKARAE